MVRQRYRWLALFVAALLSCAVNPVSRRPELVLISHERELEIGREESRKVEESMGLVRDPNLALWVESVGMRLAGHSPRRNLPYHFYVVDSADANAFALPGGHVYVTRGLLALVNQEDELASILGHEIGHVAARHSVRRMTVAAPFAVLTGIPALLTGIVSPALGNTIAGAGQLAGGLVLAPYSRDQEREADRLGMELAALAGWDPASMSSFLSTLERDEQASGATRRASWLDTHPATPERVRQSAARADELERGPRAPDSGNRTALVEKLDGLLLGDDPSQGVFVDSLFLHPDLDLAVRFPTGWETYNDRAYVAAVAPDEEAFVSLHVAGEGDDPLDGARADGVGPELEAELEGLTLAGLPARRLTVERRGKTLVVTWLARQGLVYRFSGVSTSDAYEAHRATFASFVASVRGLSEVDRERVREIRLRGRRAEAGETLPDLLARHASSWTPAEAAIANALDADVTLHEGQLVKMAIPRVYRGGER
jgi:predicted Zn-dependent protease